MRGMKTARAFAAFPLLAFASLWSIFAAAQATAQEGAQQFADFGAFKLRNGSVIRRGGHSARDANPGRHVVQTCMTALKNGERIRVDGSNGRVHHL